MKPSITQQDIDKMISEPSEEGEQTCSNCRFFNAKQFDLYVDGKLVKQLNCCRRRSPNPYQYSHPDYGDYTLEWPVVGKDDWCGEWEWGGDED